MIRGLDPLSTVIYHGDMSDESRRVYAVVPNKVADAPVNDPETRRENGHSMPRNDEERNLIAGLQTGVAVRQARIARATGKPTKTAKARNRKLW